MLGCLPWKRCNGSICRRIIGTAEKDPGPMGGTIQAALLPHGPANAFAFQDSDRGWCGRCPVVGLRARGCRRTVFSTRSNVLLAYFFKRQRAPAVRPMVPWPDGLLQVSGKSSTSMKSLDSHQRCAGDHVFQSRARCLAKRAATARVWRGASGPGSVSGRPRYIFSEKCDQQRNVLKPLDQAGTRI